MSESVLSSIALFLWIVSFSVSLILLVCFLCQTPKQRFQRRLETLLRHGILCESEARELEALYADDPCLADQCVKQYWDRYL